MKTPTALVALWLSAVACSGIGEQGTSQRTSVTTSKGTFAIPGPALADGKALDGKPINVWTTADRKRINCTVQDREPLVLLRAQRNEQEDRYYFEFTAMKGCTGWVSEPFVQPDPDVQKPK